MDKFLASIRRKYRERVLNRQQQWPPVSGERFINLHLVQGEKKKGFRAGLPQHGAPDNKTVKHTPILHGDLFKVEENKKPVRKVIVEGNAGIGKTTLCTMLAEGWAEGKILTQFDCVLLLPLRENRVSSATSLAELFKLLHSSEKIRASVIEELEEREGEGVLIIADGWDELSEDNQLETSFLYDLLFGDVLPFASVILTSRPSASAPLHNLPSVDRLIEVVGFNTENIKQYIESEFEQFPEKASSLIEQLENNPVIQSVCSVPLNCAIVCNLWYTLDQELPRTLTELYTQIVLNVILRNIKKKLPDCPIGLNSFDEIPNDLQDTFWLICEFAYECLLLDQLVFSEAELSSRLPEVGDKLQCFGLLQSARSLLPFGHGLSFHFAHLTIQEFLAALHLATLPNEEKLEVVMAPHARSVRFDMVWRFMFGLASKHNSSRSDKVINLNGGLMDQFLVVKKQNNMALCHVAFEASDPGFAIKICKNIVGQYILTSYLDSPFDYVTCFYVLRHMANCDNMFIRIANLAIDDKLFTELTDILSNAEGKLQVRNLSLEWTNLSDKAVVDLFKRASAAFTALDYLFLSKNSFTNIVSSFIHMSCTSLTRLKLSDNPLRVSGILSLVTAVQSDALINLKTLGLSNTLTDDADVNGALLTTLLQSISSHCAQLVSLDLSDNSLGLPGLYSIVENIPLRLNEIELGATHDATSFHSLQYVVTCEMLYFHPYNLKSMYLSGSNLCGAAGALLLAKFLQVFQTLKRLNCSYCSLTSADIIMLIHHLKSANVKCKSLNLLDLSNNYIDDEGVIALTECLPNLYPSLKVIRFVGARLDNSGGVVLRGNPVSEELICMCNEHLEAFEESRKTAMLNNCENMFTTTICLLDLPQNEEMARVFYKPWDTLLSKLIEVAEVFDLDQTDDELDTLSDDSNYEIFFPDYNQNSPYATESPSDEPTCSSVLSTQITEQEETYSVVSVADSSQDERVTPPLPTSSPRATQIISELTLSVLDKELKTLTKPIKFGVSLGIPQHRLEVIEQDYRFDTEGQKIALFQFIAKNYKSLGISWNIIADALHDIDYGDLSSAVRGKYCMH